MNRKPNLSDGSAGFDISRLFQFLEAGSTLNLTPRLRCPIFDFVFVNKSAAALSVFSVFKYSLLWIEMSLLVQAGVYLH